MSTFQKLADGVLDFRGFERQSRNIVESFSWNQVLASENGAKLTRIHFSHQYVFEGTQQLGHVGRQGPQVTNMYVRYRQTFNSEVGDRTIDWTVG